MFISNFTFPSWFENLGEEVIFDNDCLQSNTKDCEKNVCSHQEKVTTHPRRRPGVRARCVVHIVTLCATKRCARGVVHIPNWFCPTWLCHHLLQLPQLEFLTFEVKVPSGQPEMDRCVNLESVAKAIILTRVPFSRALWAEDQYA